MTTFTVAGESVDTVLKLLSEQYSSVYRNVWQQGNRTIGIFVHEDIAFSVGRHTLTTIVEHLQPDGLCEITVLASGGAGWFPARGYSACEKSAKEFIESWILHPTSFPPRLTGFCSYCGEDAHDAVLTADGKIRCRKCARILWE